MPTPPPALAHLTPEALWEHYGDALVGGVFNILMALAILVAGVWITRWFAAAVNRVARRHQRIDNTLAAFFASIVRYGLLAFVFIAVLDRFGVQTTQIIAVLGAATLAIGLALQGTLSNVAAGVMLILFRPYRIGDFVEVSGQKGTVRDVNLFVTELSTPGNVKVTLPNAQCWGAPISNFTFNGTRMLDMTFTVSWKTDLDAVTKIIFGVIAGDARTLKEPAPFVKVSAVNDYSVTLLANFWCRAGDILHLRLDLTKAVKEALDDAKIDPALPTSITYQVETGVAPSPRTAPKVRDLTAPMTARPDDDTGS